MRYQQKVLNDLERCQTIVSRLKMGMQDGSISIQDAIAQLESLEQTLQYAIDTVELEDQSEAGFGVDTLS